VAADNLASRRVAEKAGFQTAGTFIDQEGIPMIKYLEP
jgi:RimJ/RimL family protein N-acetyltransferase